MKTFLLFLSLFLFSNLSQAQTYLRFLNKYEIQVEDTSKIEFKYFELIQEFGTTVLTNRYLKDSTKISEKTTLIDSLGNQLGFRKKEFFESGKTKSIERVDEKLQEKSLRKFYENGNLKSEVSSLKGELVFEKYLSIDGAEIPKPENRAPSPKGELKGWYKYLASNLKYPSDARSLKMEGTVILVFMIDKEGNIHDSQVFNKGETFDSLEKEALRVIQNYPDQFIPAIEDGELVEVIFKIPLRFKLS